MPRRVCVLPHVLLCGGRDPATTVADHYAHVLVFRTRSDDDLHVGNTKVWLIAELYGVLYRGPKRVLQQFTPDVVDVSREIRELHVEMTLYYEPWCLAEFPLAHQPHGLRCVSKDSVWAAVQLER
eukprot:CAMPEP_0170194800 /NCGR_PEP_ID=MMETSP0040_2-20121228/60063_1 /TAXON_ID=641309 /ORGANISM="Lotharella oceanica, Strain CCMP622" /LENGTH=124 /DNA_ID=CAMNT_0010443803 /DNA_START=533 /DNA_END=903 /DNA_ORIENTATION=+